MFLLQNNMSLQHVKATDSHLSLFLFLFLPVSAKIYIFAAE